MLRFSTTGFPREIIHRFAIACCAIGALTATRAPAKELPPFHIQAHRGAGDAFPENTLESFEWSWKDGVTPESDKVTNYFWAVTHDFLYDDLPAAEEFHRQSHQVIGEDIAVFKAQQEMLERQPFAPVVHIRYDAGPLQARRMIDARLAAEARERGKEKLNVPA